MTRKKIYKSLIWFAFIFTAIFLLCANALFIWVATGPRSLDAFTSRIEAGLAPAGSHYRVKIEAPELAWDGWRHPVSIHMKNVRVISDKGEIAAIFPEVRVQLYLYRLLFGRIGVKSLEVYRPSVLFVQGEDGNFSFEFNTPATGEDAGNPLSMAIAMLASEDGDNPITQLRSLIIHDATLSVKKSHSGIFLQSSNASFTVKRRFGKVNGTLNMPLAFGEGSGELNADFSLNSGNQSIKAEVVYSNIPSTVLHDLFPAQQWTNSLHLPLSGWVNVMSDFNIHVSSLDFLAEAGAGTIDYPAEFEKPLKVQRIHIEGSLTDGLSTLTVRQGVVGFKNYNLTFDGKVHRQADDYAIEANAETASVPVDAVHNYWPLQLGPEIRQWIITHISKGTVSDARVALHFKPGDLKLKELPESALDATIDVDGATVKYLQGYPLLEDATGAVHFTGKSMDIKFSDASYLSGTHTTSATLVAPDLDAPDVWMSVNIAFNTVARDIVTFLSLPDINRAKPLHLTRDITGKAKGTARLDFVAFSDDSKKSPDYGRINYVVKADLDGISQSGFLGNRNISDAHLKLDIDNKALKASGTTKINEVPASIDLMTRFTPVSETTYTVKLDMPIAKLPEFGLPSVDFAKGTVGIDGTFITSEKANKANVLLDLAGASIDMPDYGFTKKSGQKATLKFSTEQRGEGITRINSFVFKGDDSTASGKGEYDLAKNDFTSITLDSLRMGDNNLTALEYEHTPDNHIRLAVKGQSLDMSPYIKSRSKSKNPNRSYAIDFDVAQMVFGKDRELKSVSVLADCGEYCTSARINATLRDGTPFNYAIQNGKLNATCTNAGELVRVLGIVDGVSGGKMTLTGDYKNHILAGRLQITNYVLKRVPVLTKIITMASLTGILDTLSGNGITFERLTAAYLYKDDVLTIRDAKTHGPALGITTEGTVDLNGNKLDLNGTLVPSYTLNSLVGDVPVIGKLLVGGTGKGVFALNYSVKGDMDDPSIRVNPLSAFTPGFTRGIFNIFDKSVPDFDAVRSNAKTSTPATTDNPQTPAP